MSWMDELDAATFQCNHPATVTSSSGQDCCNYGWICMLLIILVDEAPVREDWIVVEYPESDQQSVWIADDVRGIRMDLFSARFIVRGCLFSGGWGPLAGPGARLPYERIRIDQLVGALLGHALHDGPQQRELVRCILAVPGQQSGHYARIETCHEE